MLSDLTNEYLIEGTKESQDHLVQVIHRYFFIFKQLTDKQREVLFDHLEDHGEYNDVGVRTVKVQ